MVTDAQSRYRFRTLKPVAYPGRSPHIHLKVATADGRRLTRQFYIAGDPLNERDFVYREAMRDPRQRERDRHARRSPRQRPRGRRVRDDMDIVIALKRLPLLLVAAVARRRAAVVRQADRVVAGIDEVHRAGDAGAQVGQ